MLIFKIPKRPKSYFELNLKKKTKCSVWALKVNTMNMLDGFEMWIHRRIQKVPWTARKILRWIGGERDLFGKIEIIKTVYLRHVILSYGKTEGRRGMQKEGDAEKTQKRSNSHQQR